MRIPLLISIGIATFCFFFPKTMPLFLGLAAFVFLTNRVFTNRNFEIQEENNGNVKKDMLVLRKNQEMMATSIQKLISMSHGTNKQKIKKSGEKSKQNFVRSHNTDQISKNI